MMRDNYYWVRDRMQNVFVAQLWPDKAVWVAIGSDRTYPRDDFTIVGVILQPPVRP